MKKRILSFMLACSIVCSFALLTTGCGKKNNAPEDAKPLWEASEERNKIVVISDLHLGIDDSYAETVENKPRLIEFLKRLQKTNDVRELVIAGDFLDEWYLPVYYPSYTDSTKFYQDCIANNQNVIDELKNVIASGIKLVYVAGNHDMLLSSNVLETAIPGIVQARDVEGLGTYYTGNSNEIVIEHGHRYDAFSAPDTFTNAEICKDGAGILPPGYFYARYAATWVLEGRPTVAKDLPVITNVPDKTDTDQYGAYMYYYILKGISERMTPNEGLDEKIFDVRIAGFNDSYTYLDFFPAQQENGTISAPVLYRNIQRTWEARQEHNLVKVPNTFVKAAPGTTDWRYFMDEAKIQYIDNPNENVEIVVFGHTHVPTIKSIGEGALYVNSGTWIDHNTTYDATRTIAVITTGESSSAAIYSYEADGSLRDLGEGAK